MKEVDPPPPLDAGADTPEELRAVLRALGREAPGRGTLERAARGLAAYMDAAPGLPVPVAAAARTGGKLMAARALAALLAVGGTAYVVHRAWPAAPDAARATQTREVPAIAAQASVMAEAPEPAPAVVPLEATEVAAPDALRLPTQAAPEPRPRARSQRHHARRSEPLAAPAAATPVTSAGEAPVVEVAATHVSELAPVAEQLEPQAMAKKLAEPPPDEVALLWQARTRLRDDPGGALALLDAAATRFETGQLAPEREVLAIEALRALGRRDEAETRARAFRARYPGSIHLRRLEKAR